jgi:hypothetical protein
MEEIKYEQQLFDSTYSCEKKANKYNCEERYDSQGYNLESCNNICKPEYFEHMLPKIIIAKNPLSEIVYGLGKWLGVGSEDEYLKYPFDEEYVKMFYKQTNLKQNLLLDEFLTFINYTPNIYIIQFFINIFNNAITLADAEYIDMACDLNIYGYDMNDIMLNTIEIYVNTNLNEPVLEDADSLDSSLDDDVKKYNFLKYLKEITHDGMDKFNDRVQEIMKIYPSTTVQDAVKYCGGYIQFIETPEDIIKDILFALEGKKPITAMRVAYRNDDLSYAHMNILIFDAQRKKIYYVEPHGEIYSRMYVFVSAFRICFLLDEFIDWDIEIVDVKIQSSDSFCDTWCTLCLITTLVNKNYNFKDLLVLFNGLHNGINIVLVWYFYLFKKISTLCGAYFKISIHDYIKQTIRSFSNLKTSKNPFSIEFDGITHKNEFLFILFNNSINAATKQYFTSTGTISHKIKVPTRITSKIRNVNDKFLHLRRTTSRDPTINYQRNNNNPKKPL